MEYLSDGVIIAVVIGMVSSFKIAGLPSKFAPLVSILLGFAISVAFPMSHFGDTLIRGLIFGLSASGLYSGVKASITSN